MIVLFLANDLSMLLPTGIVLHRIMSFDKPAAWSRTFVYCLTIFLSVVVTIRFYLDERVIQQSTFVMVIVAGTRIVGLIDTRISDLEVKKQMRRLSRSGTGMFDRRQVECFELERSSCTNLEFLLVPNTHSLSRRRLRCLGP